MRKPSSPQVSPSTCCFVVHPWNGGTARAIALVDDAARDQWIQQYRDYGAVSATLATAMATGTHVARCYAWEPLPYRWWMPWRREGRWREVGSVLLRDGWGEGPRCRRCEAEGLGATCRCEIAANEREERT